MTLLTLMTLPDTIKDIAIGEDSDVHDATTFSLDFKYNQTLWLRLNYYTPKMRGHR